MEIAVGAKIPHGQFGKEFVRIRAGIRFQPEPFLTGSPILLIEQIANLSWHAMVANAMREFMHANIASAIAILFQSQQVFLPTGSEQAAHASRALVSR